MRARQAETEAAGRLLEPTNDDFLKAGFYRVLQPHSFGGYEFPLTTYVRMIMEIARGCPSSAWVPVSYTHLDVYKRQPLRSVLHPGLNTHVIKIRVKGWILHARRAIV